MSLSETALQQGTSDIADEPWL